VWRILLPAVSTHARGYETELLLHDTGFSKGFLWLYSAYNSIRIPASAAGDRCAAVDSDDGDRAMLEGSDSESDDEDIEPWTCPDVVWNCVWWPGTSDMPV